MGFRDRLNQQPPGGQVPVNIAPPVPPQQAPPPAPGRGSGMGGMPPQRPPVDSSGGSWNGMPGGHPIPAPQGPPGQQPTTQQPAPSWGPPKVTQLPPPPGGNAFHSRPDPRWGQLGSGRPDWNNQAQWGPNGPGWNHPRFNPNFQYDRTSDPAYNSNFYPGAIRRITGPHGRQLGPHQILGLANRVPEQEGTKVIQGRDGLDYRVAPLRGWRGHGQGWNKNHPSGQGWNGRGWGNENDQGNEWGGHHGDQWGGGRGDWRETWDRARNISYLGMNGRGPPRDVWYDRGRMYYSGSNGGTYFVQRGGFGFLPPRGRGGGHEDQGRRHEDDGRSRGWHDYMNSGRPYWGHGGDWRSDSDDRDWGRDWNLFFNNWRRNQRR